jgi:hypothetical protein
MNLDIRLPMGMLFTIIGVLLTLYGVFGDRSMYQRSLGYNVNLDWGLVLLAFGILMFVLGRKGTTKAKPDAS